MNTASTKEYPTVVVFEKDTTDAQEVWDNIKNSLNSLCPMSSIICYTVKPDNSDLICFVCVGILFNDYNDFLMFKLNKEDSFHLLDKEEFNQRFKEIYKELGQYYID